MDKKSLKQFLIELVCGISDGSVASNPHAYIDLIVGLGDNEGIFEKRPIGHQKGKKLTKQWKKNIGKSVKDSHKKSVEKLYNPKQEN